MGRMGRGIFGHDDEIFVAFLILVTIPVGAGFGFLAVVGKIATIPQGVLTTRLMEWSRDEWIIMV